jgi:hypothetical protein
LATGRHPERVPVNYLHGIPRFYEGADRAEIIWEDAEVDHFCQLAPELHADAVRLARETGLRIGDLVELDRSEIKRAPDGSRAIILRPNKRRRRIVNMPLTPAAEAIIDKARISRLLILKPLRADAWGPARLSRSEDDRDGVGGHQRTRPRNPHRLEDRDRREDARRVRRAESRPRRLSGFIPYSEARM